MHESTLSTGEKSAASLDVEDSLRETVAELANQVESDLAGTLNDLTDCLLLASTLFYRALTILEKPLGPEHPHSLICREHWQMECSDNKA